MENKNVVITGGNAGIGLATSIALAKKGANIFLVSRSKEKAEKAQQEIAAASGNKKVQYFLADLSSQKSIRNLSAQVHNSLDKIDVLINNAGAVFPDFTKSVDGIEMTIATNHFAYFLLTNLLLDLVKKSDYARIVNVASRAHVNATLDFASFTQNKNYSIFKAYGQSKLANILFTAEFAKRLGKSHVTINSLHPGLVKTDIGNKNTNWYSTLAWTLFSRLGGLTVEKGAETSIYLASSDEVKYVTGKYFAKCKETEPSKTTQDESLQRELWTVSEKLCPLF
jgi:NAD(P)-dependent dehydrogenase (short-subunit alcohol dehydrogenase family)